MKTGILVAVAALALVGVAVATTAVLAAPHTTYAGASGGMGGSYGGMMNGGGMMGGQNGGMMGSGSCPYQGNYAYCQQYMYDHNDTSGNCPMMG